MDARRFDQWTQSIGGSSTRRVFSRLLAGGTFGALLAHVGRQDGEAACVAPGKKCKTKRGQNKCCGGAKCRGKKCKCAGGRRACGKKCCGRGQICAGGGVCVTGQGTCPAGADSCAVGDLIVCNNNPDCGCAQRLQGGTRCVQPTEDSAGDQCVTDDDCLDLGFPRGSSCMRDEGACRGSDPARGTCTAPCGALPPTPPDQRPRAAALFGLLP